MWASLAALAVTVVATGHAVERSQALKGDGWRQNGLLERFCQRSPEHERCLERFCRQSPDDERCQTPPATTRPPTTTTTEPPPFPAPQPTRLAPRAKFGLRDGCKKSTGQCQQQSADAQARRAVVEDTLRRTFVGADVDSQVDEHMTRTMDAKRAILLSGGLDDVVPVDDGIFQGDLLLTGAQADRIIGRSRRKRYSLFLEDEAAATWTLPISYVIDSDYDEQETDIVRRAIQEIESKTCIRFKELSSIPGDDHILFKKVYNGAYCGLSFLGRIPRQNVIWLNFNCGTIGGTSVHETLHALGVDHQHVRYDRDTHIRIDWANVNAQMYDLFVGDNAHLTSYGLPYDYYSIMHYPDWVGARDFSKPTMVPRKQPQLFAPVLGQRIALSDRDAELLRKMYCLPDCVDSSVYCGWWATTGYCESHARTMVEYCAKSCNTCPAAALKRAHQDPPSPDML